MIVKRSNEWPPGLRRLDLAVLALLRISLGVVCLWFGALKFFPELSPAQDLATRTIKNLVLISAGIVVGATVRGGRMVPEP
jgi:uncharacterized membrane protein YkgB